MMGKLMMPSPRLIPLFAMLLVAFLPPGRALAAANPIIGTWRLTSGPAETCGTGVTFAPATETDTFPGNSGYGGTHRVTYNFSPAVVYVIGNNANPTRYEFVGPNTMQWRGERNTCVYQRAGTSAAAARATGTAVSGNPLFGSWTLVQPAPKGCYTTFRIGPSNVIGVDYSGEEWPMSITSYEVRGGTVIANGSAGAIAYSISGPAMTTGNPPCSYKRG